MHRRVLLVSLLFALLAACGGPSAGQQTPYVVLVGIDGFRYDYAELHGAPNLDAIAQNGVRARAMPPVFPSQTFPSTYAIATGLLPEHNGIVGNAFFDRATDTSWIMSDPETGGQAKWYGGTPIWTLAEQQGVRTATVFWPATDLPIQGTLPSDYLAFDGSVSSEDRVKQALDWLAKPEAERPRFITLMLSDVDQAGHRFGPETPETRAAVETVDGVVGTLREGIAASGLPVNLIVVSDHGMIAIDDTVELGKKSEFEDMVVWPDGGPFVMLYGDPEPVDQAYAVLKSREAADAAARDGKPRFEVYRKQEIPERLRYRDNERIGDILVMANTSVGLSVPGEGEERNSPRAATHGFDVDQVPEMQAIFYAEGPNFPQGVQIEPFESIDIYPAMAALLGLQLPEQGVDGSLETLMPVLRNLPQ